MARGWESKSVENQINEKEDRTERPAPQDLTPEEAAIEEKRKGLLLARTHILNDLKASTNPSYRALLERKLEQLNAMIAQL